jgi:hypothetical protein
MLTSGHFNCGATKKYKVGPGGPYCGCCTKLPPWEMKVKVRRANRRIEKMHLRNDLAA